MNDARVEHCRREFQSDAEFLLSQSDRRKSKLVGRSGRNEDLSAGKEAAFLSTDCDDSGFGQDFDQAVSFCRIEEEAVSIRLDPAYDPRAVAQEVGEDGIDP